MTKPFEFISSIGINPKDKEDTILRKRFLVYQALAEEGNFSEFIITLPMGITTYARFIFCQQAYNQT